MDIRLRIKTIYKMDSYNQLFVFLLMLIVCKRKNELHHLIAKSNLEASHDNIRINIETTLIVRIHYNIFLRIKCGRIISRYFIQSVFCSRKQSLAISEPVKFLFATTRRDFPLTFNDMAIFATPAICKENTCWPNDLFEL